METQNKTLQRYYTKKKKRKKRKKFAFYTLLTVFFVLVITVLSLTVFFNIDNIEVTGNSHYSTDDIIAASGLVQGQNMFKLNKFKTIENIKKNLPYLSEVTIDRHLPVGIEIIVSETSDFMYVSSDSGYYILDETLKVLDIRDAAPKNLPEVKGIDPNLAQIGDIIIAQNSENTRLGSLTSAIKRNIGDGCITGIDVTTAHDVSFEYMGKLTVKVGSVENIENKLKLVKYVIDENRSNEQAVIDVSSGSRAYYHVADRVSESEEKTENSEH